MMNIQSACGSGGLLLTAICVFDLVYAYIIVCHDTPPSVTAKQATCVGMYVPPSNDFSLPGFVVAFGAGKKMKHGPCAGVFALHLYHATTATMGSTGTRWLASHMEQ